VPGTFDQPIARNLCKTDNIRWQVSHKLRDRTRSGGPLNHASSRAYARTRWLQGWNRLGTDATGRFREEGSPKLAESAIRPTRSGTEGKPNEEMDYLPGGL